MARHVAGNEGWRDGEDYETMVEDHAEVVKERERGRAGFLKQGAGGVQVPEDRQNSKGKGKERGWFGGIWPKDTSERRRRGEQQQAEGETAREVVDWVKEKQCYLRQQKVDQLKQRWLGKKVPGSDEGVEYDDYTMQSRSEPEIAGCEGDIRVESHQGKVVDWEKEKQGYRQHKKIEHMKQHGSGNQIHWGNEAHECPAKYQPGLETVHRDPGIGTKSTHIQLRHSDPVFLPPRPRSPFPYCKYMDGGSK